MNDETMMSDAPRRPFPALRFHKCTRRFFVDWEGRSRYWPAGTCRAIAQADYDAMRAAYEAGAPVAFRGAERAPIRTIDALIDAYLSHCDGYYANSKATVANIERALAPLHERFGKRPVDTFGPRLLREVRQAMIDTKWSRKVINARVQCIVRMFKWAVAEELVPSTAYEALRAVEGLRLGRTGAHEGPGRRPVPWEHVEPVLPHVSREVAAMLVVQAESGARPGEVVQMRHADLDRSGKVWTFKPQKHKTQHLGRTRLVPLFAAAQRALDPFLCRVPPPPPDEPIFSPMRAEEARSVLRRRERETRVQPSQLARVKLPLDGRGRPPRSGYDVNSYARAVRRGIEAVNAGILREGIAAALLPLVPESVRGLAAGRLARLPGCAVPMAVAGTPERELEEQRLRRALERLEARVARRGARIEVAGLLAAALAAVETLREKLLPFWSPYQLRHRFATEGERRFGETAVSLAMGHASLRMTEHYIERNLKAVFERMAEQG